MGNVLSGEHMDGASDVGRQEAVTEARRKPAAARPASELAKKEDIPFIKVELNGTCVRV